MCVPIWTGDVMYDVNMKGPIGLVIGKWKAKAWDVWSKTLAIYRQNPDERGHRFPECIGSSGRACI